MPPLMLIGLGRGWQRFWFQCEYPARSLRWFRRLFFGVLGIDCFLQLVHAPRYGAGDFNVPHLTWLDIDPAPGRAAMVVLYMAQAYLALRIAGGAATRWTTGLLAGLFGAAYFASQLDSYQHHYLVFLLLLLATWIPWSEARDDQAVRSWAIRLILLQLSVLYMWTTAAKLDRPWLSGLILQQQLTSGWGHDAAAWLGWGVAARLIAGTEFFLALAIHVRRLRPIAVVVGISLHCAIEALGFRIGLFSWLMVASYALIARERLPRWAFTVGVASAVAIVWLGAGAAPYDLTDPTVRLLWFALAVYATALPAPWRHRLGPALARLRAQAERARRISIGRAAGWVTWAVAVGAGSALIATLPFEGAMVAAIAIAALSLVAMLGQSAAAPPHRQALAHLLVCASVAALHAATDVARDYYTFLGGDLRRRGDLPAAVVAYERAVQVAPGYAPAHARLGDLYAATNQSEAALRAYRAAADRDPNDYRGELGAAILYDRMGHGPEALAAARAALRALQRTTDVPARALAQARARAARIEQRWSSPP